MLSLRAHRIAFSHSFAVTLFSDADFHLTPGWSGLVGANGAGKTTLLRILAGELRPDEGHLVLEPEGARVILCPQSIEHLEPAIVAFAEAESAAACRLRGALRLDAPEVRRWSTLSPGERKRWQIGAAIALDPEILLLDEPTNHLDASARGLLLGALRRFSGVGLVVSHDREILNDLATSTLRLHRGAARLWSGPYDVARAGWEAEEQGQIEAHRRAREDEEALHRRLVDARRDQAAASANRSSKRRMKDKNDHDARGMLAKFRASSAEKRIGREVGTLRRELSRASDRTASVHVEKSLGRSVFVDYVRSPSPWLLTLDEPAVRAGDAVVLRDVHVRLGREDRVHLEGDNGSGKTTLVRALLASSRIPASKILSLPQDIGSGEARALLEEMRGLPPAERGRVLSIVAALGVDPDRLLASREPSPGEARKLMIAAGLGRHAWALVLDEPTNHLDLPSIERLEAALGGYPGALLLVTHDRAFARRCTSARWRIEAGTIEPQGGHDPVENIKEWRGHAPIPRGSAAAARRRP